MKIKFKKLHPEAIMPKRAHPGDAGLDLIAISVRFDNEYNFYEYDTGLAVEIELGFVGLFMPRSSVSKTGLHLCNGVGCVDSGYIGPLKARFYKNTLPGLRSKPYEVGERIGQLVIVPCFIGEIMEVNELSETSRGQGGFGSSGA
jgi:dUTP pyrophosphatase